ncbi:MAG TPA: glycosyltransferase family 2 protein [Acetobacteraceae bacterium]|nr:glycosyltransferase family 2 protein [Acetobacteraceae bacterium]
MKLVAVSRVRDEEELIEPFLRHHAALVHTHVLLDNGSSDRTVPIMQALRAEGLDVHVYRNAAVAFAETLFNTLLARIAARSHGADWVLFLDADEFLDVRGAGGDLAGHLAQCPASVTCLRVPSIDYLGRGPEPQAVNVLRRLTRRRPAPGGSTKVFLRGALAARDGVEVDAGNHAIIVDGVADHGTLQDALRLAHFPDRDPHQMASKAILGRLKVLAAGAGEVQRQRNVHYVGPFEAMQRRPLGWLAHAAAELRRRDGAAELVDDPLPYLGTPLTLTRPADPAARAIALLARYAEALARAHGALLDASPALKDATLRDAAALQPIIGGVPEPPPARVT